MSKNKKKATIPTKPKVQPSVPETPPVNAAETEHAVEKPAEDPVEKPTDKPAEPAKAEPTKAEEKKVEEKKAEGAQDTAKPKKKAEKPKEEKIEIPEVVEDETKTKKPETFDFSKTGMKTDARMDHNHAVDLLKMMRETFLEDENVDPRMKEFAEVQNRVMLVNELLFYNHQVESDYETAGVKLENSVAQALVLIAKEVYGFELKSLPAIGNPKQTILQLSSSIPKEMKKEVAKAAAAREKEVPAPDPSMSPLEMREGIEIILSKKNGIGNNILNAISWARKALSLSDDMCDAQVLATIDEKFPDLSALRMWKNAVDSKFTTAHSILGAHALFKSWLKTVSDEDVAKITMVMLSSSEERKTKNWNDNATADKKASIDNTLTLVSRTIKAGNKKEVLDAIIQGKPEQLVNYDDGLGSIVVNTDTIKKTLIASYGDSNPILKEKLDEIVKYYERPILRLSAYKDKSAYSNADTVKQPVVAPEPKTPAVPAK